MGKLKKGAKGNKHSSSNSSSCKYIIFHDITNNFLIYLFSIRKRGRKKSEKMAKNNR